MMNKLLTYLLLPGVLLFSGCYKDKSNTSFVPVNKISLSDAATANMIPVLQGEMLKLTPAIVQSVEKAETNLKYEWKIYENTATGVVNAPNIVIASTRNLSVEVKEPYFTLGITYRLIYTVTDTITGISAAMYYNLTVTNKFREGWMLLEDKATGADLAMILPDESIVKNVYSDRNAQTPLLKPVKLEICNYDVSDNLVSGKRIYILTENGGVSLSPQTLLKVFDYKDLFFGSLDVVKPQNLNWVMYKYAGSLSPNLGVAINNGKVHTNLIGGFPNPQKWGSRLLPPDGNTNYNAAPFIVGGDQYLPVYPAVVYDNAGKRFYYTGASSLLAFPTATSTEFDLNNVGMDMVYMDSTNVYGQYMAIMKTSSNVPYLLGFKTSSTVAAPALTLLKQQISDPGILQMQTAVASTLTPHLYYSTANKIYRYESTSNTTAQIYSFPAGEEVTKMVFRRVNATGTPQLAVATWNGTEGSLYLFPVDVIGGTTTYAKRYSGFAKIKDFGYKLP